MKHIFEAEIFVDTVFSVESGAGSGNWFYVADYATMNEFWTDCAGWFSDEADPEYLYTDWNGVPDYLINRTKVSLQLSLQIVVENVGKGRKKQKATL